MVTSLENVKTDAREKNDRSVRKSDAAHATTTLSIEMTDHTAGDAFVSENQTPDHAVALENNETCYAIRMPDDIF